MLHGTQNEGNVQMKKYMIIEDIDCTYGNHMIDAFMRIFFRGMSRHIFL